MKSADIVGAILTGLIALAGWVMIMTLPVYLLWNWLMPIIFGLPELTFWQALGILLLAGLLTKGSGGSDS